jgi:hypothetical protein
VFGPPVTFGLDGADAYVLTEDAKRLAPLTDADADELIRSAPLLLGDQGAPSADLVSSEGHLA